jgi:hypothetical protein
MKAIAAVLTALALTGCATPEQNILAGAAIGAIIGSEVSRQQSYPQRPVIIHQPAPVIIHQPRPYPRHCDYYPQYDRWGNYRGDRRICY